MRVRNHNPIVIDSFKGLHQRDLKGDSCPIDHFVDCLNVDFEDNTVKTRDGIDTISGPGDILRAFKYQSPQIGEGYLVLDTAGDFYHITESPVTVHGPILSIPTATDFCFVEISGRAYISPITGLHGTALEFLYVYDGAGGASIARKAAGVPPTNASFKSFLAYNSTVDGKVDKGIHVIAVSYNNGGALSTALGPTVLAVVYANGNKEINVDNIPISGAFNRDIYMTRAIDPKDWNPASFGTFYLAKTIADATSISAIISVADSELVTAFVAGVTAVPSDGGALRAANSATNGNLDLGLHVYAVVYETNSGYLTAPGPEFFAVQTHAIGTKKITLTNVPVGGATVTKRHIVASKAILNYTGDQTGYQFYFVPLGTINDNATTTIDLSYFDVELLEDASHLIDNFSEIPAGAALSTYNNRLVIANGDFGESIVYLSTPGEPEAIDQVDGFLSPPYPREHITNIQEFRDTLYVFKKNRTFSYVDNGDIPSLWAEPTTIDNGIGTGFHGISAVLDSGGVNIEFLIISHASGLYQFTGTYIKPELSWKIERYWINIDGSDNKVQIMTDSINKKVYIVLQNGRMLMVDFKVGLDYKNVKWTPWRFDAFISTIFLLEGPRLLLGSNGNP